MKVLDIPYFPNVDYHSSMETICEHLNSVPGVAINNAPWTTQYPYRPQVTLQMAYTSNSLILKYKVNEEHVKAIYHNINEPVYKDSCVEFFISFDGQKSYYNFEFNCLGIGLVGYGKEVVSQRTLIASSLIKTIKTAGSIQADTILDTITEWDLTIHIPTSIFYTEQHLHLSGLSLHGNFYKCGDDLPNPHYLSWNPIDHPSPNFHLPTFFGELKFSS